MSTEPQDNQDATRESDCEKLLGTVDVRHKAKINQAVEKSRSVSGQFDLFFIIKALQRSEIEKMIPGSKLKLAPAGEVPAEMREGNNNLHPVVFMVGRQHNFTLHGKLGRFDIAGKYDEVATFIPWVRYGDSPRNLATLHLLYLDRALPTIVGRIYGLYKKTRLITQHKERSDNEDLVTRQKTWGLLGTTIFEAAETNLEQPRPAPVSASAFPGFRVIEEFLTFRNINTDERNIPDPTFICTEPVFTTSSTKVTPVSMKIKNPHDMCPAAPSGFTVDPMPAEGGCGALWVENLRWQFPLGKTNCYS